MLESLYQLHRDPFCLAPDPKLCYEHERFRKGRAYMKYALSQGDGVLMITGHPGTGKTLLVEHFLSELDQSSLLTATLLNTQVEADDLFRMVGFGFDMNVRNLDRATILHDLKDFLVTKRRAGYRALLIVDEAQNLSASALEQLRMLTNLRERSQPLLQLFLVGQKQLVDIVHTSAMEPLYQRLIATCHLEPLGLEQTVGYIQHRLRCAGWRGDPHFTNDSYVLIYRFTRGYPRLINKICGRILLYGSVSEKHRLDSEDVFTVLDQLQDECLIPGKEFFGNDIAPDTQEILHHRTDNTGWQEYLNQEEKSFLKENEPTLTPEPLVDMKTPPDIDQGRPARTWTKEIATPVRTPGEPAAPTVPQPDPIVAARHEEPATPLTASQPARAEPKYLVSARPPRRINPWAGIGLSVALLVALVIFPGVSGYRFDKPKQATEAVASNDSPLPDQLTQLGARSGLGLYAEAAPRDPATVPPPQENASLEMRYDDTAFALTTHETLGDASAADEKSRDRTADKPRTSDEIVAAVTSRPALEEPTVLSTPVPEPQPVDPEPEVPPAIVTEPDPEAQPIESEPKIAAAALAEVATTGTETVEDERALPKHALADLNRVPTNPGSVHKEAEREIEHLLLSAKTAYHQDFLTTPRSKSAYHFLRQVLDRDPANQAARHGMDQIIRRYRVLVEAALERQDYQMAQILSRRGLDIKPGNEKLQILHSTAELLHHEALEHQQALLNPFAAHETDSRKKGKTAAGLFGEIRAFFNDVTPDEASSNFFESDEAYWDN